jgi:hypothetical protein
MPLLLLTMAANTLRGAVGWGPVYAVTAVKHDAKLGLQQVRCVPAFMLLCLVGRGGRGAQHALC